MLDTAKQTNHETYQLHHNQDVKRSRRSVWLSRQAKRHAFLEANPTYFEWIFPLDRQVCSVSPAPRVASEDIARFAACKSLQTIVLEMLDIVLEFDGLQRTRTRIILKDECLLRDHMRPQSCHLPRISRMLRSLRLLGRSRESSALFEALDDALGHLPVLKWTVATWQEATFDQLTGKACRGSTPKKALQPLRTQPSRQCKRQPDKKVGNQPSTASLAASPPGGDVMEMPRRLRSWSSPDAITFGEVKYAAAEPFSTKHLSARINRIYVERSHLRKHDCMSSPWLSWSMVRWPTSANQGTSHSICSKVSCICKHKEQCPGCQICQCLCCLMLTASHVS